MALHQNLTGADLHESKGVATATAGQVYVADGAGSGAWTTQSTSFSSNLLHVRDQHTSGTDGASITQSSYQTRVLQTVVTNEISGASLASNQITLPAGTYFVDARCTTASTGFANMFSKIRLRNTTASTTLLAGIGVGINANAGSGETLNIESTLSGRFTLSGISVLELQDYVTGSGSSVLSGKAQTTGEVEVYADVLIWKIG